MIIININANFDILYYLSNSVSKFADQTAFEINTMLYLSQLLSIYDGNTTSKWGYLFTRSKHGAPISIEVLGELERLSTIGILEKDDNGYYRVYDSTSKNLVHQLEKSFTFEWRTKYIMTSIDSILTKPFPIVVDAVQYEPGISLFENLNRTSILHGDFSADLLFEDFKSIREVVNDPNIDLIVPASLWIDCLAIQAQERGLG